MLGLGIAGCQSLPKVNFPPNSPVTNLTPNLANPASLRRIEEEIYQQTNRYRLSRQLPALKLNAAISEQARIHSESMAAGSTTFSHQGFQQRVRYLSLSIPIQQAAENVAVSQGNSDPATVSVQGWIKSPGHRKNLEGDFNLMGIGVAQNAKGEYYFTQIFVKKPAPVTSPPRSPGVASSSIIDSPLLVTLEQEAYRQVNQYRISRSLKPLEFNAQISQIARIHSQNMAGKKAPFSHDGFKQRVQQMQVAIPLRKAGENLAFIKGYPDPVAIAVQGWIDSPGHRHNMEGDFNVTGMGVAKNAAGEYYFTQLFVLKR
jgi:uncharacterized protein YkwD